MRAACGSVCSSRPASASRSIVARASQGTDGPGTVTQQAAEVMNLPGFAGLDDKAASGAHAGGNETMVYGGGGQQGRYGGVALGDVPVGQDQKVGTHFYLPNGKAAQGFQGAGQSRPAVSLGPADGQAADFRLSWSDERMAARSAGVRMGCGRCSRRQCRGVSVKRFRSRPMLLDKAVTNFSRMASRGGLVTWAKSWRSSRITGGAALRELPEGCRRPWTR